MRGLLSGKFVIFVIVGVVVAGIAWWGLSGSESAPTLVTTQGAATGPDKELVDTLLQLRTVTLSGTVLSDPAFLRLQDFGTQIVPEPVGRPNPFAPLQSGLQASTSKAADPFTPKRP